MTSDANPDKTIDLARRNGSHNDERDERGRPPAKSSKFSLEEEMRINNSKDEYHKLELHKKVFHDLVREVMKSLYGNSDLVKIQPKAV